MNIVTLVGVFSGPIPLIPQNCFFAIFTDFAWIRGCFSISIHFWYVFLSKSLKDMTLQSYGDDLENVRKSLFLKIVKNDPLGPFKSLFFSNEIIHFNICCQMLCIVFILINITFRYDWSTEKIAFVLRNQAKQTILGVNTVSYKQEFYVKKWWNWKYW